MFIFLSYFLIFIHSRKAHKISKHKGSLRYQFGIGGQAFMFLLGMESHRVLFWPTVIFTGTNGSDYLDYHFISVLLFSRIFFASLSFN